MLDAGDAVVNELEDMIGLLQDATSIFENDVNPTYLDENIQVHS